MPVQSYPSRCISQAATELEKAAKAGKHILCEKPMALTEEQVREMFAAAKANGVLLEEAYAYRHAQLAQKVKEIVDSGAIGRIRYLESKHSTFDTNRSGIRYQKGNGGGAVYDVRTPALRSC